MTVTFFCLITATSRSNPKFSQSREYNSPDRVVPSAVMDQKYMKITVSGDKLSERIVTVTCYTVDGKIP
jgi:hypothetical protein